MSKKIFSILFLFCACGIFNNVFSQNSQNNNFDSIDFNDAVEDVVDSEFYDSYLSQFDRAKTLIIVEPVRQHEMNPQITQYSNDSFLLSSLYEGLFSYNPITLEPEFALAENYKLSRDKKRCQITLRKDAKFSNGKPINSQAVRQSFLMLLSEPEAPYSSMLDIIEGAEDFRTGKGSADNVGIYCLDDNTISIHLNSPANYLPSVLCHTSFVIVSTDPFVYSGAYELEDIDSNCYFLKKNPEYWDKNNTVMEKIIFWQSDDKAENAYMMNIGFADWVTSDIDLNLTINKQLTQVNPEFATQFLFFRNSEKKYPKSKTKSVWDYQEFRNAVLEALPWENFRKDSYVAATTLVYPLIGYPTVEGFSYTDELEAKKLMEEARKKYKISADEKLPLKIQLPKNVLSEENINELKKALEPLGIDVNIEEISSYNYIQSMRVSDADIFCYTWIGDFADPLAFLELFRSNSTLNDSGYSDKEFDSLIEKAAYVNTQERYELLAQAETRLLDSGYIIPICHPVSFNVLNLSCLGGWINNAFDYHPLKYIYRKSNISVDGIVVNLEK